MSSEIRFEGLKEVLERLDNISSPENIQQALGQACALVEDAARRKAPKGRTGDLRNTIASRVNGLQGIVYSPLEYAPYVEYGTGLFVDPTSGYTGRTWDLPWAYEDEVTGELIWTSGQKPHPFMRPALDENRTEIIEIIKEGIMK